MGPKWVSDPAGGATMLLHKVTATAQDCPSGLIFHFPDLERQTLKRYYAPELCNEFYVHCVQRGTPITFGPRF